MLNIMDYNKSIIIIVINPLAHAVLRVTFKISILMSINKLIPHCQKSKYINNMNNMNKLKSFVKVKRTYFFI